MRPIIFVGVVIAAGALAGCRALPPVYQVQASSYLTGSNNFTIGQVKVKIFQAGLARKWKMDYVADGHFVATFVSRYKGRTAVVDIIFDTETFSITYKNSEGIKVKCEETAANDVCTATEIHRVYNLWIQNLERDILKSLSEL